MNKINFSFWLYALITIQWPCIAQDSIYFRNSKIETGKVSQIGQGRVLFMPDTFAQDRVVVKYRANNIRKIKYQSGRVDTVWGNPLYQNTAKIFSNCKLVQRHTFDISLYNLMKKEIRLQYNIYLKNRNLAIYIPVKTFITGQRFTYFERNAKLGEQASIGIGAKTFTNYHSKFSFYAGFGTAAGISKYYRNDSYGRYSNFSNMYFIRPFINLGYQHFIFNFMYLSFNGLFGPTYYAIHHKLNSPIVDLEVRLGFKIK